MKIRILADARDDLIAGHDFYEAQEPGLGSYFLRCLESDVESLGIFGGIHRVTCSGHHRALSKRFPFAIYYRIEGSVVLIHAILDCRRNPSWLRKRLNR